MMRMESLLFAFIRVNSRLKRNGLLIFISVGSLAVLGTSEKAYVEYSALIRTYSAVRSQERNSNVALPAPSAMRISYTGSDI